MRRRAAKAWAELAEPGFYCGHSDPFIRGLGAAATEDAHARVDALRAALAADPWPADACPTQAPIPADATAADAMRLCGLEEDAASWRDDVDAMTYIARRAVQVRLEAARLLDGDREIVLNTLLLSTALAGKK